MMITKKTKQKTKAVQHHHLHQRKGREWNGRKGKGRNGRKDGRKHCMQPMHVEKGKMVATK